LLCNQLFEPAVFFFQGFKPFQIACCHPGILGFPIVLSHLKEVINRKALDIWGHTVASFEQSRFDQYTGEKVLFSWWYTGDEDSIAAAIDSPLADVFNEKDNVIIIAQLPAPVSLDGSEIKLKNGILRLKLRKTEIE